MTTPAPRPASGLPPGPALPLVALVMAIVALCAPPLLLVSLGLAAFSLWRARTDPAWKPRRPLAQGALAVSAAGFLVFLGLVLPNLFRFRARVAQSECRATLFSLYGAQTRLHVKSQRYSQSLADLDVQPEPGRYRYRLAPQGPLWSGDGGVTPELTGIEVDPAQGLPLADAAEQSGVPTLLRETLGVHGTCPGCTTTLLCVGNLDADPTLDLWTISSVERPDGFGGKIPPGVPWNHSDDSAR